MSGLPRHRRPIWLLYTALDCLLATEEPEAAGFLPYWVQIKVREWAGELEASLGHMGREAPWLGPLSDEELDEAGDAGA